MKKIEGVLNMFSSGKLINVPSNADLRKQENQELYAEHKDSIHEVILTGENVKRRGSDV